ncbi:MAG TPA: copper resistance protein CopC [Ktedonobacteraceae bacterium]|nr:copper resistance protein CopC [Ktedonobacteraceae bacterium]
MKNFLALAERSCGLLLGPLFLAGILGFMQPMPVYAHSLHAILLRSDPPDGSVLTRSPTSVHLWFSEPVQLVGEPITVLNPAGASVGLGAVHVRGVELWMTINSSRAGTYLVSWQVISQDTDPTSGRFVFSIGTPGGMWMNTTSSGVSPQGLVLQVTARLLHFSGYALAFGVLAFLQLVLRPLGLARVETMQKWLWRLTSLGILALLCAEPVSLFAQIASLGNGAFFDANFTGDLLASSFGRVLFQRLGAALLLWVLVGIAKQGNGRAVPAALVLGIALAFADDEASHAIRSNPLWLGLLSNAVHIAAMGIWVGGLVALLAIWRLKEVRSRRDEIISLFGRLAAASVAALVLSGAIMAWLHLTRLFDLFTTVYGWALTAKLFLVLAALLVVLVNWRGDKDKRSNWWVIEGIALMSVLVLAGLLVSVAPPA